MKYTAAPRENKEPPSAWMTTRTANLIRLIHRKDDSYVGFYTPSETGMRCIRGIRAENMKEQFPLIASEVIDQGNVYFTVNGYWPGERNEGKESVSYLGRRERFLRSLNACFVDLDVDRLPLLEKPDQPEAWQDWLDAKHVVERMAENGEIPHPSIYARSGRGLYVYWLLHDEENPEVPPPAFQLDLYKRINTAIQKRLEAVAPDPAAKDGARVLRAPNSLHRNGVTVKYQVNYDENDAPPSYTLGELAERFEVEPVERKRRRFDPNLKKGNRGGYEGVHQKRKHDLERLFRAGNVRQGNRRFALTVYCYALRVLETPPKEAADLVQRMARKCSPSYRGTDETPPGAIVEAVYRMTGAELYEAGKLRHDTLAKRLGVTPKVARDLELETIVPDTVKQEREEMRRNAPTKAEERRAWIVSDKGRVAAILSGNVSLRELAKEASDFGFPCSHETIRKDLQGIRGFPGVN